METVVPFLQRTLGDLPENHRDRAVITRWLVYAQKRLHLASFPEVSTELRTFSEDTRRVLIGDGAVTYLLAGETIRGQREAGRPFEYIDPGYEIDGRNRLLDVPSRLIEIAIYPDPQRFFVPGSFHKPRAKQEALLLEDRDQLVRRLGQIDINQVLPEVSEATEVVFKHFDATGRKVRLLGENYDYFWMNTNTPTNESGSRFALVGGWFEANGLGVEGVSADTALLSMVAHWIVPAEIR